MMQYDVAVLLGGGMDSYAVLLHLRRLGIKNVIGIHVDYGQVAADLEKKYAAQQCEFTEFDFVCLKDRSNLINSNNPQGSLLFGDSTASPVIYGRNLILLLMAIPYANTVCLGLDKPFLEEATPYFDCTMDYFYQALKLIGNPDKSISAPFIDLDKYAVCRLSVESDPDFFDNFMTCWTPIENKECGECKHCLIKKDLRQKIK